MAGLLHQLLVGPRALARQIALEENEALEFWYREPGLGDEATWRTARGFDASTRHANLGQVHKKDLDAFLAARVAYLRDWFSVDQLIKTAAHIYGGHYAVVPEGLENPALMAFDEAVKEQGRRGIVPVALDEIAGVALRGLIPLAKAAEGAVPRPKPVAVAPPESGCPFGGKLNPDLVDG